MPYISSSLKRPYTSLHVYIHTYIHTTITFARPHVLSFFVVFIIVLLARKSLPAMCVKYAQREKEREGDEDIVKVGSEGREIKILKGNNIDEDLGSPFKFQHG